MDYSRFVNDKYGLSSNKWSVINIGIVERVRALASSKGETLASVERACSFGQGSIRKWDHAAPSADKLYKVAQMFDVTMEYLLVDGPQSISGGVEKEDASDKIEGISVEGLKVGLLWDHLDEPGRAIILGDIYKRLEARSSEADAEADVGRHAGRVV